jgi:hypothetical protein
LRRLATINFSSWAGLFAGPAAWFFAQQAGAWTVVPRCADHSASVLFINAASFAFALAGAWLSWRARREPAGSASPARVSFVATLSALMAFLFAVVILVQGSAALVFTGCER